MHYYQKFRKNRTAKAISIEPYVYGFDVSYIVTFDDGTKERIQYLDKSIEKEVEEYKKQNNA